MTAKTTKTAAKKPAAKKKGMKVVAAAAKNPIGAQATAAKLAAKPAAKAATKPAPAAKKAPAVAATQIPATDDLQKICDKRTTTVGKMATVKGTLNELTKELHTINDELLAAGAQPGMIFTIDGDPMQMTHHVKPSKSLKNVIADFLEAHPQYADEITALEIKHTKENQQQPDFKNP